MKFINLFTLIIFLICLTNGKCYLKDFEFAENILMENLENYVIQFEEQIANLKIHMKNYLNEHAIAAEDSEAYLSNPINAYLLTKRLTVDWKNVQSIMVNKLGIDTINNITNFETKFGKVPNKNDFFNSIMELIRLQKIYKLNVDEIANGKLDDIKYSRKLTWMECFEIGRQLLRIHKYTEAIEWFQVSLKRLQHKTDNNDKQISSVYEFLSWCKYKIGDLEKAIELCKISLKYNPDSYTVEKNLKLFKLDAKRLKSGLKLKNDFSNETQSVEEELFNKGCRGELEPSAKNSTLLYCHYYHYTNKYSILAPFKIEELNLEPYIVRIYDIVSDKEINEIKTISKDILTPGTVWSPTLNEDIANKDVRSNYGTFLDSHSHRILQKLDSRFEEMAGFDMNIAEAYNIIKYDVGGYYNLHHDYFQIDEEPEESNHHQINEFGNRLATFLIYLSNVEKGGATVFPKLKIVVQPVKGSAIFWYNLNNGKVDSRTKHGACPVLKGTKWAINKWIREKGQNL